jgi:hypothetical protein
MQPQTRTSFSSGAKARLHTIRRLPILVRPQHRDLAMQSRVVDTCGIHLTQDEPYLVIGLAVDANALGNRIVLSDP